MAHLANLVKYLLTATKTGIKCSDQLIYRIRR